MKPPKGGSVGHNLEDEIILTIVLRLASDAKVEGRPLYSQTAVWVLGQL